LLRKNKVESTRARLTERPDQGLARFSRIRFLTESALCKGIIDKQGLIQPNP